MVKKNARKLSSSTILLWFRLVFSGNRKERQLKDVTGKCSPGRDEGWHGSCCRWWVRKLSEDEFRSFHIYIYVYIYNMHINIYIHIYTCINLERCQSARALGPYFSLTVCTPCLSEFSSHPVAEKWRQSISQKAKQTERCDITRVKNFCVAECRESIKGSWPS
jgi:hypothetical protein